MCSCVLGKMGYLGMQICVILSLILIRVYEIVIVILSVYIVSHVGSKDLKTQV